MAKVKWVDGSADWTTSAAWNTGTVPTSSDTAILGGNAAYTVSITTAITVGAVSISDPFARLSVSVPGGTARVNGNLSNAGTLMVDTGGAGGSVLSIGGTLGNTNTVNIGNGFVAATVRAKNLNNTGTINITGSASQLAALVVSATPSAVWRGDANLSGKAVLRFGGTGQIKTITGEGVLNLFGTKAFVEAAGIGTGSNTALQKLGTNAGTLTLQQGASITTTVALANSGTLAVLQGGSFQVGAGLNNYHQVTIVSGSGVPATIEATGLKNYADIDLSGVSANPAALTINGNAFNFASVEIGSFSEVTASGTYTQRAGFMTVTGGLNALTVALEGGEINVAGSLNSSVNMSRGVIEGSGAIFGNVIQTGGIILGGTVSGNSYSFNTGIYSPGAPGGPLTINGNLETSGSIVAVLRGTAVGQFSTINVAGSVNLQRGLLQVDANGGSGFDVSHGQKFTIMTFTPGTLTGSFSSVQYDGFIGNANRVDIGNNLSVRVVYDNPGGKIELAVVNAPASSDQWLGGTGSWTDATKWSGGVPGPTTNALIDFGSGTYNSGNYTVTIDLPITVQGITHANSPWGTLAINNPWNATATAPVYHPMTVVVSQSLYNAGNMAVDYNGPYITPGGTVLTIGGTLGNGGNLTMGGSGNPYQGFRLDTSVSADRLINTGRLLFLSSDTSQTTLDVGGSAGFGTAGIVTGQVNLYGNDNADGHVLLRFESGQITSIASGASLSLHGAGVFVANSSDSSSNSALTGLTNIGGSAGNAGIFRLLDGGSLSTTTALTNAGFLSVDHNGPYYVSGGSTLHLGGVLTNTGTVSVGVSTIQYATTVTAAGLTNAGTMYLAGSLDATATFAVNGVSVNSGHINVGLNATLTLNGETTNYNTGLIAAHGGTVRFTNTVNGVGTIEVGHDGLLDFDAGVSGTDVVRFLESEGTVKVDDHADFDATITGFGFGDIVDLTNLAPGSITSHSYSGSKLQINSTTGTDVLLFDGSYTASNFVLAPNSTGLGTTITFQP